MKNGIFGKYYARFEGIWLAKCYSGWGGGKEGKRRKRNTDESNDDDEEEYRWRWRGIPMTKRSINNYIKRKWKKQGETKWNGGERREMMKKWRSEKSISQWIHANKRSMMLYWCVLVSQVANWLMITARLFTIIAKSKERSKFFLLLLPSIHLSPFDCVSNQ